METGFTVSAEIIDLLGNGYKSSEYAIRELVDNAWDADARQVWITLPTALPPSLDEYELAVKDDGLGMRPQQVANEYLHVANNRHLLRGDLTPSGRPVKGRKGIGKFAGLYVGVLMQLDTCAGGTHTQVAFNQEILRQAVQNKQALEQIKLPLLETACNQADHGTTVTVRGLRQTLVQPSPERIKRLLVQEYGRTEGFAIWVNGELLDLTALQGQTYEWNESLPDVGAVRLRLVVAHSKQPLRDAGIGLRVKTKLVGKPSFYGVRDQVPELPKKLLRQVYGDVEADELFDQITPHWNELPEDTRAYQALAKFVRSHLEIALRGSFQTQLAMAKARLQKQLNKELQKLPEHKRDFARRAVEQALRKFYDLPEEKIWAIVDVILNAIERDDYYLVLQTLQQARHAEVSILAEALAKFGLVELTRTAYSTMARLQFLESLQLLADNPKTTEQVMHEAIAANLWLLGPEYASLISNQSLRSTVKKITGQDNYSGANAAKRPDLLLAHNYQGQYLLLEFKRPSHTITHTDIAQAAAYRQELTAHVGSGARIDLLLIGGKQSIDPQYGTSTASVRIETFTSLISAATTRLQWLTQELASAPQLTT